MMRRLAILVTYAAFGIVTILWISTAEVIVEIPGVEDSGPLLVWRPHHGYQTVWLYRHELQDRDYIYTGDGHYRRVDLWLAENPE